LLLSAASSHSTVNLPLNVAVLLQEPAIVAEQ
jgi:hypothetical protein